MKSLTYGSKHDDRSLCKGRWYKGKKLSITRDYFFTLKFISNLITFARVFKVLIYVNNLAKCIILSILII